jgi:predicted ThiF/HesA family dinucleotide-utilizing enzyme
MALAEFFDRAALAAAQVLAGFRREEFERVLQSKSVGIAFGSVSRSPHGSQILDLAVRLAARLYPSITFQHTSSATLEIDALALLARSINPRIEISVGGSADVGLVVGTAKHQLSRPIYVGCSDWLAGVGDEGEQPVDEGHLPFGAGVAAAIGMANVFRVILGLDELDTRLKLSALTVNGPDGTMESASALDLGEAALVGCGAIGNAAVWALSKVSGRGTIHLIDHERIDLSNLQRYVLATRSDVGKTKVDVLARLLSDGITPKRHRTTWAGFVRTNGYRQNRVLVAVDSAEVRSDIQASLPGRLVNAWTQPGDLGVSVHGRFGRGGACLACLYLHDGPTKSQDQVVAEALGIPHRFMEVRHLLHQGQPVPDALLGEIAAALGREASELQEYSGLPIRRLYVEGICGGGLVTPKTNSGNAPELHVPLAHQSALAGVLLAASFASSVISGPQADPTFITRLDLMHPVGPLVTQTAASRGDGRCLCEDSDFRTVNDAKWGGNGAPMALKPLPLTSEEGGGGLSRNLKSSSE